MVNIRKCVCLISITVFGATFAFAAEKIKYNITYHHQCLDSVSLINFLLKLSLQQCVQECSLRPICLSINYRRSKLLCELYSEDDGTFFENSLVTGSCVFVKKTSFVPQVPGACPSCNVQETCDEETSLCTRKECQEPTIDHGTLIGNLRTVGTRLKCTCDATYIEAENRMYTTCEDNGQWSYIPRCITTTCADAVPTEYSSLGNVALNKPVTLSDVHDNLVGRLMVDGDTRQNLDARSCIHTESSYQSYAILDLQDIFTVYALRIYNRGDCCADRLRNVRIRFGESMDDLQLHVHKKTALPSVCTFLPAQPCRGRFLKIQNTDESPLTICELQVYGELYST